MNTPDRCCRTEPGFSGIDCPDCPAQVRPPVAVAERLAAAVNAGRGRAAFEEMARGMLDALAALGMVCGAVDEPAVTAAVAAQLEIAYRAGQADYWNAPIPTITSGPSAAVPDPARCPVCDWPLAADAKSGCVPGNCAYRPSEGSPDYERFRERCRQLDANKPAPPPG